MSRLKQSLDYFSIFYSIASNVIERHELLQVTIGETFPEEDFAYNLVKMLSWILPLVIFIAAVVDGLFAWIYMKHAHPWKGILTDQQAKKDKKMKNEKKKLRYFMKRHFPDDFI